MRSKRGEERFWRGRDQLLLDVVRVAERHLNKPQPRDKTDAGNQSDTTPRRGRASPPQRQRAPTFTISESALLGISLSCKMNGWSRVISQK